MLKKLNAKELNVFLIVSHMYNIYIYTWLEADVTVCIILRNEGTEMSRLGSSGNENFLKIIKIWVFLFKKGNHFYLF